MDLMTDLHPELADLLHDYRDDWQIERQEHPLAWVAIRHPTLTRIHVLVALDLKGLRAKLESAEATNQWPASVEKPGLVWRPPTSSG